MDRSSLVIVAVTLALCMPFVRLMGVSPASLFHPLPNVITPSR